MSDTPEEEPGHTTLSIVPDWDHVFTMFLDHGARISLQKLGDKYRALTADGAAARSLMAELNVAINAIHGDTEQVCRQIERISAVLSKGIELYDERQQMQEERARGLQESEVPCVGCGSHRHSYKQCPEREDGEDEDA